MCKGKRPTHSGFGLTFEPTVLALKACQNPFRFHEAQKGPCLVRARFGVRPKYRVRVRLGLGLVVRLGLGLGLELGLGLGLGLGLEVRVQVEFRVSFRAFWVVGPIPVPSLNPR